MIINHSTPLINTNTGEYPVYLSKVRRDNPQVSFPNEPTEEQLSDFGYRVVITVTRPEGDVVTEGTPILEDGQYHQSWIVRDYTEEERLTRLNRKKDALFRQLEELYEADVSKGFPFEYDGTIVHIQCRDKDRVNIMARRLMATELHVVDPEMEMTFRCYENTTMYLTPQEMVEMTNATIAAVEALYIHKWSVYDSIKDAVDEASLPTLPVTLFV